MLIKIRNIGDYGGGIHVTEEEAKTAVKYAHNILKQVSKEFPDIFLFEQKWELALYCGFHY